jgi:ribonuclease-3
LIDRDCLARRLQYRWRDPELLERALRHRSSGHRHNERLEFLGDAVLGLVIAAELFSKDGAFTEGDLSRLRASLVRAESLADIAAAIQLGDYLDLGPGELKTGGFRRQSILADTLEAAIGAVYVDGGFGAAEDVIKRLFGARLANLPATDTLKDAKTRLQEYLQARNRPVPKYTTTGRGGPPHNPTFTVSAAIEALGVAVTATGKSRRTAEQAAAGELLDRISDG